MSFTTTAAVASAHSTDGVDDVSGVSGVAAAPGGMPTGSLHGRRVSSGSGVDPALDLSSTAVAATAATAADHRSGQAQGVSPAATSVARSAENAGDGDERVFVPKPYWEKGYWTAVYYCAHYQFLQVAWSARQAVMDAIYAEANQAAAGGRSIDIGSLTDELWGNDDEKKYKQADVTVVLQGYSGMVTHALGGEDLFKALSNGWNAKLTAISFASSHSSEGEVR